MQVLLINKMPQVITVLKCYKCNVFQTQIEKKSKQWCCALCGEKQSLKHVYGSGTGKDCRLLVMQLNSKTMHENERAETRLTENHGEQQEKGLTLENLKSIDEASTSISTPQLRVSKWTKYLEVEPEEDGSDEPFG